MLRWDGMHTTRLLSLLAILSLPTLRAEPSKEPAPEPKETKKEEVEKNENSELDAWLDAALKGNFEALPEGETELDLETLKGFEDEAWKAYKSAAQRSGWDKDLLPTPLSIEEMAKLPKEERTRLRAGVLKSDGKEMPYVFVARGEKPKDGWPLFIAMHGGGKYHGPAEKKPGPHGWNVNSREWQTQVQLSAMLYKPAGLYFVPRMADDNLGRWWHKHNIDIFTRMINRAILFNQVDPNKVYIMGISQGGYGSCHLGPYMADLFAAAGPMAGGMMTVTENLRNLPFRSDIGEHDTAYKRITLAKELHDKIDSHRKEDPEGYKNLLAIQKGKGHGIDYSLCPSWLVEHTRNPHPDRVVWRSREKQGLYRESFYWLSLSEAPEKGEVSLEASVDKTNNTIEIKGEEVLPPEEKGGESTRRPLTSRNVIVHLNDRLVNLDQEITVHYNGKEVFKGKVKRTRENVLRNLVKRGDPNYAFPAEVVIKTS